jgi:hypothetical protein
MCKAPHIDSVTFRTVHHIHSMASGHLQSISNRIWDLQDICKAHPIDSGILRTEHQIHSMAFGYLQSTSNRLQDLQDSTSNSVHGFQTSVKHLKKNPGPSGHLQSTSKHFPVCLRPSLDIQSINYLSHNFQCIQDLP